MFMLDSKISKLQDCKKEEGNKAFRTLQVLRIVVFVEVNIDSNY